jgi:Cytochrome oxidase complex assembly protein 1
MLLSRWLRNVVLLALAPVIAVLVVMHSGERRLAAEAGLRAAEESHLLDEQVGPHLHMGLLVVGWMNANADGGTADLSIPIRGSRGRGSLYLWAQRDRRGWQVCSLDYRPFIRSRFRSYRGPLITIISDQTTHCERE